MLGPGGGPTAHTPGSLPLSPIRADKSRPKVKSGRTGDQNQPRWSCINYREEGGGTEKAPITLLHLNMDGGCRNKPPPHHKETSVGKPPPLCASISPVKYGQNRTNFK